MSQLKLYKKFYLVSIIRTGATVEQNYVLMNPYVLSANTYVAGTGATESPSIIETSLPILQESAGVYFADLNPYLYASDVTYDLVWFVNYIETAPTKKISTRFRINVNTVTNQIEVEYINTPLEIEILNSSIDIEVLGKY
jgi:hypothetical protein